MLINGTLLAQGVNFVIFYFLLKKIFFKPAVNNIMQARKYISLKEKNIESYSKQIYSEHKKQSDIVDHCRSEAKSASPNIFKLNIKALFNSDFDKSKNIKLELNKKDIVQELKKVILEKSHVA